MTTELVEDHLDAEDRRQLLEGDDDSGVNETGTALTLPQRAAVALGAAEHEKQLALMVAEAKTITEIKNLDGRTQCHATYMTLKNARVAITKTGKNAREDAKAFCDAVIAEEKRLIGITEAEETRLQALRDKWDAGREAEHQAKIEAERKRIQDIRDRIEAMRNAPLSAVGSPSSAIRNAAQLVADTPIDESFAEFRDEAMAVRSDAFNKLESAAIAAEAQEAEAARVAAEREELARLRAEAEQRRQEQERQAAEAHAAQEAELKAWVEKQAAEIAAQREELEHQQAEIDRQNAAIAEAKRLQEEEEAASNPALSLGEVLHATLPAELAQASAPTPAPTVTEIPAIQPVSNTDTGARLRLGEINARIAPLAITADGLSQLGFPHIGTDKSAKLYRAVDFPTICAAIIRHVEFVSQEPAKAA